MIELQKYKKLIIVRIVFILILILGFFTWRYLRVKFAKIEIILNENMNIEFLENAKVSDFITSINGTIVDDYEIDTTKVGKQKIEFTYINEDNIKLDCSYEINIIDTTAPLVWLNSSYNVLEGSQVSLVDDILCGDNYDSNPTCEVIGDYNMNEAGSYNLVFKATDSSGNVTEKEFTLNVRQPSTSSGSSSSSNARSYTQFADVVAEHKNENTEIGIDISKWQGNVDFNALKEAGVEFVIIRVGTSDGIGGENLLDSKFIQNIEGANKAGIPVGIYFYSYADSKARAEADAKWVLDQIKDYDVSLPIAFDWENWNFYNDFNLSFFGLSDIANSFVDVLKESGYEGMLYSSKTYLENIWYSPDYPVWLAHYTSKTNYAGEYSYWQICNNGRVDGIDGDVDINIRYLATE